LENLSPNLSPTRREALNSPPSHPFGEASYAGKGAGGLGLIWIFLDGVKSQAGFTIIVSNLTTEVTKPALIPPWRILTVKRTLPGVS